MRLFTALWPVEDALRHLDRAVRAVDQEDLAAATGGLRKFRFISPDRWHLTLCFHGDDADLQATTEQVESRVAALPGVSAPRLRLSGAGTFRGVLWIGVQPAEEADETALRQLVGAAGGDARGYEAHLTIARWLGGRLDRARLTGLFADYAGPWWEPEHLSVMSSELRRGGPIYRTVHRVALPRRASG